MSLFHTSSFKPMAFPSWVFWLLLFLASLPVHGGGDSRIQGFALDWELPLHSQVSASPVVADGHLLVAAENGNLYVFDLASRQLRWLYHTQGVIAATPAVAEGRVYLFSRDGFLHALELSSGRLLWRFATGGERVFAALGGYGQPLALGLIPDPWDFFASSPLVVDDRVYIGSSDGQVYALEARTGELLWVRAVEDPVHASPVHAGGVVYIGTWGTRLYALDAARGEVLWHFQGGADRENSVMLGITAAARVDDERIYVGARDGFFYALDRASGKPAWRYDASSSWILTRPWLDGERVYFGTSDTGLMLALNRQTGEEVFRVDTRVWTYASPVGIGDGQVMAANMTGELMLIDSSTGQVDWYYQTPSARSDWLDIIDDQSGKFRGEKLFGPGIQLQASVEKVRSLGGFLATPLWTGNALVTVDTLGVIRLFSPVHAPLASEGHEN